MRGIAVFSFLVASGIFSSSLLMIFGFSEELKMRGLFDLFAFLAYTTGLPIIMGSIAWALGGFNDLDRDDSSDDEI